MRLRCSVPEMILGLPNPPMLGRGQPPRPPRTRFFEVGAGHGGPAAEYSATNPPSHPPRPGNL
jgi:hypothetical protein